jgi:hypothetical protein
MTVLIPYGRVVEFRKWYQAHPHIIQRSIPGKWTGSMGARVHARAHLVTLTDEKYATWLKLAWAAPE